MLNQTQNVYTVQLVIPRDGVTIVEKFEDVVITKVFNVRASSQIKAVDMALNFEKNKKFIKGRVDERDFRFNKPEHLSADVVEIQVGYLNPDKFPSIDHENMHRRIDEKFGRNETDD